MELRLEAALHHSRPRLSSRVPARWSAFRGQVALRIYLTPLGRGAGGMGDGGRIRLPAFVREVGSNWMFVPERFVTTANTLVPIRNRFDTVPNMLLPMRTMLLPMAIVLVPIPIVFVPMLN